MNILLSFLFHVTTFRNYCNTTFPNDMPVLKNLYFHTRMKYIALELRTTDLKNLLGTDGQNMSTWKYDKMTLQFWESAIANHFV